MASTQTQVYNSALALDSITPGWEKRVDVDTLDMMDVEKCILGQVYGRYGIGRGVVGDVHNDNVGAFVEGKEFWIAEIQTRLNTSDEGRIAQLAKQMDEDVPGWANRVDVDKLAMHDPEVCVLAQVYGDYSDGKAALGLLPTPGIYAGVLSGKDDIWKSEIEARQTKSSIKRRFIAWLKGDA